MPTTNPKTQSKSATVIAMLKRGKGATLNEIGTATQWQTNSIRAFLIRLRKKGHVITHEQCGDEGKTYRIAQTPDQNAEPEVS